jgi:hypothetical protein
MNKVGNYNYSPVLHDPNKIYSTAAHISTRTHFNTVNEIGNYNYLTTR